MPSKEYTAVPMNTGYALGLNHHWMFGPGDATPPEKIWKMSQPSSIKRPLTISTSAKSAAGDSLAILRMSTIGISNTQTKIKMLVLDNSIA